MANKSFITARIPDELNEKLESYAEETGESKTNILIDALNKYLNSNNSKSDIDINLEERVKYLENFVYEKLMNINTRIDELEELKILLSALRKNDVPKVLPTTYKQDKDVRCLPPGQPTA